MTRYDDDKVFFDLFYYDVTVWFIDFKLYKKNWLGVQNVSYCSQSLKKKVI